MIHAASLGVWMNSLEVRLALQFTMKNIPINNTDMNVSKHVFTSSVRQHDTKQKGIASSRYENTVTDDVDCIKLTEKAKKSNKYASVISPGYWTGEEG